MSSRRFAVIGLLGLSGLVLLAGCGGGTRARAEPELVTASKGVVQAIPRMGNVTQSSNIDPATKMTLDTIDVVLDDATGAVTVHNRRGDSVQSHTLGAGTAAGRRLVPEDIPEELGGLLEEFIRIYRDPDPPAGTGSQLVDLVGGGEVLLRLYANGFLPEEERVEGASPCRPDAGRCYGIVTNRRALSVEDGAESDSAPLFDPAHLDYWVLGTWIGPQGGEPPEIGAFAAPSRPLTTDELMSVSRLESPVTATYVVLDASAGVTVNDRTGSLEELEASEFTLTATFGGTETPAIGGRIIYAAEMPALGTGGWSQDTITLEGAAVDLSLPGGFFQGTTSHSYAEGNAARGTLYETPNRPETGHWGGQFFGGLDGGDNNLPNSVAGTFASEMDRGPERATLRTVGAFVGEKFPGPDRRPPFE